jgi:hypothetical protein
MTMTKARLAACLLAASPAGCGQSQPSLTPMAPHGGTLVKLPDAQASAEIVRQDAPDKPGRTRLLLYYYGANLKPMTPAPTSATLKPKGRGVPQVELKPTGDPDPARAGELASPSFQADGDVAGELSTTIGGKPVTVTISVR